VPPNGHTLACFSLPGRHPNNGGIVRYVLYHDCARTNCHTMSDYDTLTHRRTNSDPTVIAYTDRTREMRSGTDVNPFAQHAIVINRRACIDDASPA